MAYRFKSGDPSVADGVRRIALAQIDAGLAEIDDAGLDPDRTVHQVRKRAKKLRGLIRLVRPAFPTYGTENAAFRAAGRRLSGFRDRTTLLATHDRLMARGAGDRRRFAPVRRRLTELHAREATPAGIDTTLARVRRELVEARARAECWQLERDGEKAFEGGLGLTLGRARAAMADAARTPTDPAMHEWRKRVKYHWYHARLLRPAWPGPMGAHAEAADTLAETLGDHHDLALYLAFLDSEAAPEMAFETMGELTALGHARQSELEALAFGIGRRLFAEKTKPLTRRWRSYWRVWRAEASA